MCLAGMPVCLVGMHVCIRCGCEHTWSVLVLAWVCWYYLDVFGRCNIHVRCMIGEHTCKVAMPA